MQTDDLIGALSAQLEPVRKGAVARTLALGLGLGALGSILLMVAILGVRRDLAGALAGSAFWIKFSYTLVIALLAVWMVERSGRPGTRALLPLLLLSLPLAGILGVAAAELMPAQANRHMLLMGDSARVCALLIVLVSVPLFAGVFWALRRLAPTSLTLAGAAAGLLAGSAGATIYAFHCTESAAPFVAIWYTAGILLTTAVGAGAGRWLLRW